MSSVQYSFICRVNGFRGWSAIWEGFREWGFLRCVSDVSGVRVKWSGFTESELRSECYVMSHHVMLTLLHVTS